MGVGVGTLVSPMYISEVATRKNRAMLMGGCQTVLQVSVLAGFWIIFLCNGIFEEGVSGNLGCQLVWQLVLGVFLLVGVYFVPGTILGGEGGDGEGGGDAGLVERCREGRRVDCGREDERNRGGNEESGCYEGEEQRQECVERILREECSKLARGWCCIDGCAEYGRAECAELL